MRQRASLTLQSLTSAPLLLRELRLPSLRLDLELAHKLAERFKKTSLLISGVPIRESALKDAQNFVSQQRFRMRYGHPWEDEHGNILWNPCRMFLGKILLSKYFELFLVFVITCNVFQIIIETNLEAKCFPQYDGRLEDCPHNGNTDPLLYGSNLAFVTFYSCEAVARIYVERITYFKQRENLLDFAVCITSIVATLAQSVIDVTWLRILRAVRLVRIFDIVCTVPELRMIFVGFKGSMRTIACGAVLIMFMLLIASILLVQYIHPLNASIDYPGCTRCKDGFASVEDAVLTLYQQIVAADNWGQISVPIAERYPWAGMVLCIVQLLVGMGAMNLILAVVVDRAAEAREANREHMMYQKLKDQTARKIELLNTIAFLDEDQSGFLSKDEISRGLRTPSAESFELQRTMVLADVTEDDLWVAYDLLAQNEKGEVSYLQLCDVLDEFQAVDVRKLSVLSKLQLNQLTHSMCQQESLLEKHSVMLKQINDKIDTMTHPKARNCTSYSRTSKMSNSRTSKITNASMVSSIPQSDALTGNASVAEDSIPMAAYASWTRNQSACENAPESMEQLMSSWTNALSLVKQEAVDLCRLQTSPPTTAFRRRHDQAIHSDGMPHALACPWSRSSSDFNEESVHSNFKRALEQLEQESNRTWSILLSNLNRFTNGSSSELAMDSVVAKDSVVTI